MTDLVKCKKEGCDPRIQVRGEMGPGDYDLYLGSWRIPNTDSSIGAPIETGNRKADARGPARYHEAVELDDSTRGDKRVRCATCGKATGWAKGSIDVPGRGPMDLTDEVRKDWNSAIAPTE